MTDNRTPSSVTELKKQVNDEIVVIGQRHPDVTQDEVNETLEGIQRATSKQEVVNHIYGFLKRNAIRGLNAWTLMSLVDYVNRSSRYLGT